MRNPFFLLFVLFFSGSMALGQMYSKSVDVAKTISFESVSGDMTAQHMITLLTSSFNGSARGFRLKTEGTIHLEVLRLPSEKYDLQVVFHRRSLSGNNTYRGFHADTVLWPGLLKAQVQIFNGRHLRREMDVFCLTDGSVQNYDVTEFITGSIGEISIKVNVVGFQYQEFQFDNLSHWVDQVKTYYSYGKLLHDIEKRYRKYASDNQRSRVSLWIDRLELDRLMWLLHTFNAEETMHLSESDPAGLISLKRKIVRYSQRAETLFEQSLSSDVVLMENEPLNFSSQYVELSTSYIHRAKKLQPADAIVPMQMASLYSGGSELSIVHSLLDYFMIIDAGGEWQIPQYIDSQFVRASDLFMENEDYANALLLLNNASVIQSAFNFRPDENFEDKYLHAFEGVTSSYLKVGRMASVTGNTSLSGLYFKHVLEMIDANQLTFTSMSSYDSAMPSFFSEIIQLSHLTEAQLAAEHKLAIFEKSEPLVNKFGESWLIPFRQGYGNSSVAVFKKRLSEYDRCMSSKQYPDAAIAFDRANEFYEKRSEYLSEEITPMIQLSNDLFRVYLSQSNKLLEAGQPSIALEQLELAKNIGVWLPPNAMFQINSRIDSVVIPLIKEKIDKVKFDIWAMHLNEAEQKLQEVDSIEQCYLNGNNPEILHLIRETRYNLHDRICVAIQQKIDVTVNEVFAALRSRSYKSALKALEMANNWRINNENCQIDTLNYYRAKQACEPLITFLSEMKEVKSLLFNQGYNVAIDRYVKLKTFILNSKLDTLGVQLPALYSFVGEQRLPMLTVSTIHFYVNERQYFEALRYLWLAKDQKMNKNDMRTVMRMVAAGLAEADKYGDLSVDEALEKYTRNDQYFSYFKFVYRKNRLL